MHLRPKEILTVNLKKDLVFKKKTQTKQLKSAPEKKCTLKKCMINGGPFMPDFYLSSYQLESKCIDSPHLSQ